MTNPGADRDFLRTSPPRSNTQQERLAAARYAATRATNAEDLSELLDMLGLDASDGVRQEEVA